MGKFKGQTTNKWIWSFLLDRSLKSETPDHRFCTEARVLKYATTNKHTSVATGITRSEISVIFSINSLIVEKEKSDNRISQHLYVTVNLLGPF